MNSSHKSSQDVNCNKCWKLFAIDFLFCHYYNTYYYYDCLSCDLWTLKSLLEKPCLVWKFCLISFRSLNKDSVKKSEVYPEQETVAEMPSPQPISNPTITGSGNGGLGVTINGNEPSVFSDVPGNSGIVRQSIPDHIKPDQLPKDELRSLVRQQLEYYFSRYVLVDLRLVGFLI